MDATSIQTLVESVSELKLALEETKKQYGAVDRLRSDWEERWKQTKDAMFEKAEAVKLMARVEDIAARDIDRRSFVAPLDYSMRSLRAEMKESKPAEARAALDLFLTRRPATGEAKEYHRLSAKLAMMQAIMRKQNRTWTPAVSRNLETRLMWREYLTLGYDLLGEEALTRAFDSSDVSEWIPTILSTELARYIECYGALIPNLVSFDLPAGLYEMPITTGAAKARMFTEQTGLPSAGFNYTSGEALYHPEDGGTVPTGKIQFNAEKLRTFLVITGDLREESVIPMIEWGLEEVGSALRRAIEDACWNGNGDTAVDREPDYDTRNTALGFSYDARQAWGGIRKAIKTQGSAVYDAGTTEGGTFTIKGQIETLKLMKQYGVPGPTPSGAPNVMMGCSMRGYLDLLDTPEYLTRDKAGDGAANATGAVGAVLGIPVILSEYMRTDVSATGFNTVGGPNTKTSYVYWHRPSWMLGTYRGAWTEQERLPGYDQNVVWAWYKGDFQKIRPSTQPSEAALVNVT